MKYVWVGCDPDTGHINKIKNKAHLPKSDCTLWHLANNWLIGYLTPEVDHSQVQVYTCTKLNSWIRSDPILPPEG